MVVKIRVVMISLRGLSKSILPRLELEKRSKRIFQKPVLS
ncbi:hypothetical protein LEP1GSC052_3936 [Leptospira kmetyi serovar Malaysia str. Bejo-Iso9]|nr:hypothetical protein LEP1GSC052_3936 [Leptospira kmetyi serovar Malaysia str. Bejo-Iso9]